MRIHDKTFNIVIRGILFAQWCLQEIAPRASVHSAADADTWERETSFLTSYQFNPDIYVFLSSPLTRQGAVTRRKDITLHQFI